MKFPPYECHYCGKRQHEDRDDEGTSIRKFACGVEYADCIDAVWYSGPKLACVNKLRRRLGMEAAK